jgi:hypothetical protein
MAVISEQALRDELHLVILMGGVMSDITANGWLMREAVRRGYVEVVYIRENLVGRTLTPAGIWHKITPAGRDYVFNSKQEEII